MINTQYINLNMIPSGVMPVLYCSQYDIGRPLGVVVYNGAESVDLSVYTCTIEATRTDKTPVTAAVTTSGNIGVFETTATMTNQADTYKGKLVLTDGNGKRVASLAFVLVVTVRTMDEDAEEIEEDASLYQQYTGTVQTIIASIRADLAAEITARQNAISTEASTRAAAVSAEASARQSADNTLQSNINAEASTRATQDASLQSQIDQLVAPSGEAPSAAEVENARIGSDGTVYPTLGDAIRTQNSLLKSHLEGIKQSLLINMTDIGAYLYKHNCYINQSTAVETQISTHDLYKIPISKGDLVYVTPTTSNLDYYGYDQGFSGNHVFALENNDGTYTTVSNTSGGVNYFFNGGYGIAYGDGNIKNVCVCVYHGRESLVKFCKNWSDGIFNDTNKLDVRNTIYVVSAKTAVNSKRLYLAPSDNKIKRLTSDVVHSLWIQVKQGDLVTWTGRPTGISYYGAFTDCANSAVEISSDSYTVPSDGLICTFDVTATPGNYCTVIPANTFKIRYNQILDRPVINHYDGLSCVAFGTSLTYRDTGYRPVLASLLGMTIDNQGVGSSYWLTSAQDTSNVLYNVQQYTGYADKAVCIIEGCVNDWYYAKPLGTYTDTGTDTVCGCLYNMLSHIYAQNPDIQIFVILDHYGKTYNSIDNSSSRLNSNNQTQYEYYSELAKVCEYYGIPCIKEYAISSIGIFGTEYIADNIHLTALGAQQSASVIAKQMLQIEPKKTA